MMNASRTLWMGNIETWMDSKHILSIFKSINIVPLKLNIPIQNLKKGCCFVEFDSPDTANKVLYTYNGKNVNGIIMKLNWVNSHSNKEQQQQQQQQQQTQYHTSFNNDNSNKRYTIYVGNIDKKTTSDELKSFFLVHFSSVQSAKIIYDPVTGVSKGFGFVDFGKYDDYINALNSKVNRVLKGSKLIINPTKPKKDNMSYNNCKHSYFTYGGSKCNNEYITVNNNSNKEKTKSVSTASQTSCSFAKSNTSIYNEDLSSQEHIDGFNNLLTKGFNEIAMMYNSLLCKPLVSFQCNYYCGLNPNGIKDDGYPFQSENSFQGNSLHFIDKLSLQIQREQCINNNNIKID